MNKAQKREEMERLQKQDDEEKQIIKHGCKHEADLSTVQVHKYGRQAKCVKCGRTLVAFNIVKVKPRRKPKMSKKARLRERRERKRRIAL